MQEAYFPKELTDTDTLHGMLIVSIVILCVMKSGICYDGTLIKRTSASQVSELLKSGTNISVTSACLFSMLPMSNGKHDFLSA